MHILRSIDIRPATVLRHTHQEMCWYLSRTTERACVLLYISDALYNNNNIVLGFYRLGLRTRCFSRRWCARSRWGEKIGGVSKWVLALKETDGHFVLLERVLTPVRMLVKDYLDGEKSFCKGFNSIKGSSCLQSTLCNIWPNSRRILGNYIYIYIEQANCCITTPQQIGTTAST